MRLTEIEWQIQQHCMYPHPENNSSDNVQLLAPDYNPDIDQDNQLTLTTSTQGQEAKSNIINAKDSKENNNQIHSSLQHPNWPDTSTIQIPTVSSNIPDPPPLSITSGKPHKKTNPPNNNTHRGRRAARTNNKPSPQQPQYHLPKRTNTMSILRKATESR